MSKTKKEKNIGSKQKQEENLKRLLTQLTNEMKQKYSLGQIDGKQKDFKEDSAEKLGKNTYSNSILSFRNT